MIYLASPYSHPSPATRDFRALAAAEVAAALILKGFLVYSPIVYGHQLVIAEAKIGTDWEQWKQFDQEMIFKCDQLWVLNYSGWRESKGIKWEVGFAEGLGKPIGMVDYRTLEITEGNPLSPSSQFTLPLDQTGMKLEV